MMDLCTSGWRGAPNRCYGGDDEWNIWDWTLGALEICSVVFSHPQPIYERYQGSIFGGKM